LQARSNLFTYSEQIDNAVWTKSSATISANTTVAPDGTTTADTLTASAGTGLLPRFTDVSTVTVNGSVYSASVFARAGTYSFVQIYLNNQGSEWANYTLTGNGTATANGSCTATISNVGSGWYRLTMTYTAAGTDRRPFFMLAASATATRAEAWNPVGTETVVFWGAQLELGSTATTYQRIVTATDYADVGLPRNLLFDGTDDSLATVGNVDFATWTGSEARRNLLTMPTMFDDTAWTKTRSSVTANTTTAPDGTTTADKLVEDTTASATHPISVSYTTAASAYTLSVYVKAAGRSWVQLSLLSTANAFGNFNVSNGTLGTIGAAATAGIEDAGNGWYRCRITATTAAGANTVAFYPASADNTVSYTGDGTSGLQLWGAQLEVGSTATAFQDVGTDKVTLFSGVTKLSDAAAGMIVELSANQNSNAGGFYISAAETVAGNYGTRIGGNRGYNNATFVAPITNVISLAGDLAASGVTTGGVVARFNGIVNTAGVAGTTMPGGNFGSYLLYVGRRGGTTVPFNGRLFQLVIRGAATDSVTVGNAERWVGQLTGVAL
jgi:hypothetical protein